MALINPVTCLHLVVLHCYWYEKLLLWSLLKKSYVHDPSSVREINVFNEYILMKHGKFLYVIVVMHWIFVNYSGELQRFFYHTLPRIALYF